MKKISLSIFALLICLAASAQFKTRIFNLYSDIPVQQKIIFNNLSFNTTEKCFGANVCVGNQFLNSVAEYNFHSVNISNITGTDSKLYVHEFLIGLRYYPARPTFMINKTALRFTAGAKGGWDINLEPRSMYFAGFGITGVRNPSGILIEGFYHRSVNGSQGYLIQPYYGIRLGLTIGPSME